MMILYILKFLDVSKVADDLKESYSFIHVHVNKYKYYRIKFFSNTYNLKVF